MQNKFHWSFIGSLNQFSVPHNRNKRCKNAIEIRAMRVLKLILLSHVTMKLLLSKISAVQAVFVHRRFYWQLPIISVRLTYHLYF